MFCTQCGNKLEETQKFCNMCGRKLDIDEKIEAHVIEEKFVENKVDGQITLINLEDQQSDKENEKILEETNFITTQTNLMILCSLIGFASMLFLPFTKIFGENYTAFSMLNFDRDIFGEFILVFIIFCIGAYCISISKLKAAKILYAIGTIMLLFIIITTKTSLVYSFGIGAWILIISSASVALSKFITNYYYTKYPTKDFELPATVKDVWSLIVIVVFAVALFPGLTEARFNKSISN